MMDGSLERCVGAGARDGSVETEARWAPLAIHPSVLCGMRCKRIQSEKQTARQRRVRHGIGPKYESKPEEVSEEKRKRQVAPVICPGERPARAPGLTREEACR